MSSGGVIELAHPFDQPTLVHGSDLIQDYLACLTFEAHRDTSGVWSPLARHGSNDDLVDVFVHLVGRDDETRTGLTNFTSLGRI